MNKRVSVSVLTEVFPIEVSTIPTLTAYQPDIRSNDTAMIAGKLAFHLQKVFSGHWIWSYPWIVTDTPQAPERIQQIIEKLWEEQADLFQGLHALHSHPSWQSTVQVQADFVARGLWNDLRPSLIQVISPWAQRLSSTIRVARTCEVRGWVVQDQPALSVSIDSRLITDVDVQAYVKTVSDPTALLGLFVIDKVTACKGTIMQIVGTVGQHRMRLLKVAKVEKSREYIREAADNELVVKVYAGKDKYYDYSARSLQIIVRTTDYERFHVNARQATQILRIAPDARASMIRAITAVAKAKRIVKEKAFSSSSAPGAFLTAQSVNFLGLPLIKCACLLRQKLCFSHTLPSMS